MHKGQETTATLIMQPCGHRTALQGSRSENALDALEGIASSDTESFLPHDKLSLKSAELLPG